jgi:pimeloyl-ACP methyl ester carboxylesterase
MNARLVEYVESTVKSETSREPDRPVYLVGETVGACIALAMAARNPDVNLVLILINPVLAAIGYMVFMLLCFFQCFLNHMGFNHLAGTAFHDSQLQSLSAFLDLVPEPFHLITPQLINFLTDYIFYINFCFGRWILHLL